jgi:hypothetical protein
MPNHGVEAAACQPRQLNLQHPARSTSRTKDAMLGGTPGQRKALLKELMVEVRAESRNSISPTFRLPATSVRVTETMVGRGGLEPPTSAVAQLPAVCRQGR